MPFAMRELQSAEHSTDDTAAAPDDIPYSIIRQLPGVAIATLLGLYNAIWTQGVCPNP